MYICTFAFLYMQTHMYVFQVDLTFDSLPKLKSNKFAIAEFVVYSLCASWLIGHSSNGNSGDIESPVILRVISIYLLVVTLFQ